MRRSTITAVLCSLLFAAASAGAQPAAAPKPQSPPPTAPKPAVPPPPDAVSTPPATPKAIEINDPMLAPVPAAPHTLAGWKDALSIISTRSTDVLIAQQEIEKSEGLTREALAAALPSLTGQGSITHNFITDDTLQKFAPSPSHTLTAQLTVQQPILAPRAWYQIDTAKLGTKTAKSTLADKKRTTLAAVADSIVAVVTSERVAEVNRIGLRASLERLELTSRKARLGSGTRLDVVRAEQDAMIARTTLVSGDEALRKSRESLGLLLGSAEPYGVSSTISLNEIEQTVRQTCPAATPEQRSDVIAAKANKEIAERGVTDSKLAFVPTASLSSTLSASNGTTSSGKDYAWSISGVITIPIWEGGARYGSMRVAKAQDEEAKLRVDATVRQATLETNQASRAVLVADQARQLSEKSRDLAKETARLSQVAFEAGTGTSFDLVDSGRRQREAEIDLAVKEFDVIKAKIAAMLASANCTY
jgi:outer membrane protein TolC